MGATRPVRPSPSVAVIAAVAATNGTPRARALAAELRGALAVGHRIEAAPGAGADVVVAVHDGHDVAGGQALHRLVARAGRPLVTVLADLPADPSEAQRLVVDALTARAEVVTVPSHAARLRLLTRYRVDHLAVQVVPTGASLRPSGLERRRSDPRPYVLQWGSLRPGCGLEAAIDAIAALHGLIPAPRLVIATPAAAGHARAHALIAARAARAGVADRIEVVAIDGPEALAEHIGAASAVVVPYTDDAVTSRVLTESLAAGQAVVATAFPFADELLGATGAGVLVPRDDPDAFARALGRVLCDHRFAAGLRARAPGAVAAARWPVAAERIGELVDAAATRAARRTAVRSA
jgi:glycosyltransferase involved in cell wall biosynthesis